MKVEGESEKRTRGDGEPLQRERKTETKTSAKNRREERREGEENEESANLGRERKGRHDGQT